MKVAVLGASGSIGSRLVEWLHLSGSCEIIPVVRSYTSLSRLARFNLPWKLADACDEAALRDCLQNCDVVVDCVLAKLDLIEQAAATTYSAAVKAGVQRVVYLSSGAVHGQAPSPGTSEESALSADQPHPYNRAKIKAEQKLSALRQESTTELVILRPSIVYGPRSRWISELADQLLNGTACLIDGGHGICNSIYVDNLVEAIRICLTHPQADRQAFLVGDAETVTWADFYRYFARALHVDPAKIADISASEIVQPRISLTEQLRQQKFVQLILPYIPQRLKTAAKAALMPESAPGANWMQAQPKPMPTAEMAMLQQCTFRLGFDKAGRIVGYKPVVSFEEGCKRSAGWLRFCGYPGIEGIEKSA